MDWNEMFRREMFRLHTHEEDMVPTLERIQAQADGAATHEILLQMIEAAPARLARLDVVCSFAGWEASQRVAGLIKGWRGDFEELLAEEPKGVVLDAMILALLLKIMRLRTAGYESAYLLATNLNAHSLANLLAPMWAEDREADNRVAEMLSALVRSGGADWDECLRLSQT